MEMRSLKSVPGISYAAQANGKRFLVAQRAAFAVDGKRTSVEPETYCRRVVGTLERLEQDFPITSSHILTVWQI